MARKHAPDWRMSFWDEKKPERNKDAKATARGVCPRCGRALQSDRAKFTTESSTWFCPSKSCAFVVEMPKSSKLYRRARVEFEVLA